MNHNGCIWIISSRHKCLPKCLASLYKFYNRKYDYPVYIYYFDDIYDSSQYRSKIHREISKNIHFISIPYKTPKHIKESELFYNRKDLWYARTRFNKNRKGYLHMCNFNSNFYGYPNTEFHKYDYAMSLDDESLFLKEIPYSFFDEIANRKEDMGALKIVDQNIKKPHQGNFDTRVGLWKLIRKYLAKNNITPKSKFLQDLLVDPDSEQNFHLYPIADSYVIKLSMCKKPGWVSWLKAVNKNGGIYKYRWGDNDITSLGYLINYDHPIYDFKTVDDGYHDQGGLRKIQNCAPSVKHPNR
jgi:hypothetical protein